MLNTYSVTHYWKNDKDSQSRITRVHRIAIVNSPETGSRHKTCVKSTWIILASLKIRIGMHSIDT